jgi:transposase-like protein
MSRRSTMEGEKKRRRKFDREFKIQAVKLLIEIV